MRKLVWNVIDWGTLKTTKLSLYPIYHYVYLIYHYVYLIYHYVYPISLYPISTVLNLMLYRSLGISWTLTFIHLFYSSSLIDQKGYGDEFRRTWWYEEK